MVSKKNLDPCTEQEKAMRKTFGNWNKAAKLMTGEIGEIRRHYHYLKQIGLENKEEKAWIIFDANRASWMVCRTENYRIILEKGE